MSDLLFIKVGLPVLQLQSFQHPWELTHCAFFAFSPQTTGPTLGLANNAFVQGMANTMDRHRAEERAAQGIPTHQNQDGIFSFGQH